MIWHKNINIWVTPSHRIHITSQHSTLHWQIGKTKFEWEKQTRTFFLVFILLLVIIQYILRNSLRENISVDSNRQVFFSGKQGTTRITLTDEALHIYTHGNICWCTLQDENGMAWVRIHHTFTIFYSDG